MEENAPSLAFQPIEGRETRNPERLKSLFDYFLGDDYANVSSCLEKFSLWSDF